MRGESEGAGFGRDIVHRDAGLFLIGRNLIRRLRPVRRVSVAFYHMFSEQELRTGSPMAGAGTAALFTPRSCGPALAHLPSQPLEVVPHGAFVDSNASRSAPLVRGRKPSGAPGSEAALEDAPSCAENSMCAALWGHPALGSSARVGRRGRLEALAVPHRRTGTRPARASVLARRRFPPPFRTRAARATMASSASPSRPEGSAGVRALPVLSTEPVCCPTAVGRVRRGAVRSRCQIGGRRVPTSERLSVSWPGLVPALQLAGGARRAEKPPRR